MAARRRRLCHPEDRTDVHAAGMFSTSAPPAPIDEERTRGSGVLDLWPSKVALARRRRFCPPEARAGISRGPVTVLLGTRIPGPLSAAAGRGAAPCAAPAALAVQAAAPSGRDGFARHV